MTTHRTIKNNTKPKERSGTFPLAWILWVNLQAFGIGPRMHLQATKGNNNEWMNEYKTFFRCILWMNGKGTNKPKNVVYLHVPLQQQACSPWLFLYHHKFFSSQPSILSLIDWIPYMTFALPCLEEKTSILVDLEWSSSLLVFWVS
jgi:hypothetical protein